jgi:heptosyltransferase-3
VIPATKNGARQGRLPDWPAVRRVLLIRLRSIGDTVLMTPCLSAIKSFRPDIEITALSEPLSAPLLEDHPLVDNLIVVAPDLASRARAIARLRGRGLDVAFNMHGGSTASIIAALSGARHTIGYGDYGLSWLLRARAPSPHLILGRAGMHSVEQQLALLSWAGVPAPTEARLSLAATPEAEARVSERLDEMGLTRGEAGFALVAPAAAFESKRWPAEGFAAVVDYLNEMWGLKSVIIAGPGQGPIAEQVAAASRSGAAVLTRLSLKELVALTALARLFVGNDSGPMHIAAALSRPLVVVFGSSDEAVWHPWTDSPYRVVRAGPRGAAVPSWPASDEVMAATGEVLRLAAAAIRNL